MPCAAVPARGLPSSSLVTRTEVRRAPAGYNPANLAAAARTDVAFLTMLDQHARRIIALPRLERHHLAQHAAHALVHRLHLVRRDAIERVERMDRRAKENLVGVQIADAGHDLLRHQQRFDCAAALLHESAEQPEAKCRIERIETQGMLANVVVWIGGQVDDSEQSHVFKRQVTSAVEVEYHPGEAWSIRRIDVVGEVAGHPEVQMQPIAFARLDKEMFAMPAN